MEETIILSSDESFCGFIAFLYDCEWEDNSLLLYFLSSVKDWQCVGVHHSMSFKSLVWRDRLSQWELARQKFSSESGSQNFLRERLSQWELARQKFSSESGSQKFLRERLSQWELARQKFSSESGSQKFLSERLSKWELARKIFSSESKSQNFLRDRLSKWELARQKFSSESGSHEDFLPDASDCGSLEEAELHPPELESELRQPLSRKIPMSSFKINPYRVIILLRLVVLVFFLYYRLTHPVENAYGLWLASVICEVWLSISWTLDQFPKWRPVTRETYLERLFLRCKQPGKECELAFVDVFVGTVDPLKESPLVIANNILSILSVDYPSEKFCCYISDDGASLLTFETLLETCEFAKKWVPFCKKFYIEPTSPECYFSQKIDHLQHSVSSTFPKERRSMKRYYEEFKVRISSLVERFQVVPSNGWVMKDGTPWPGNNIGNHPAMIQILLGSGGLYDSDSVELPHLVYISREKRPGFKHNDRAGAMNALVRVSALLTNGAYILNLDCDHYINNRNAFLEAMCYLMDPTTTTKVCYIQFPQRFDGIDSKDWYANHKTVLYDVTMKGLDGIQGPFCVSTGCFFNRKALYGYDPPSEKVRYKTGRRRHTTKRSRDSHGSYSTTQFINENSSSLLVTEPGNLKKEFPSVFLNMEKCFGQSPILLASNLVNDDRYSRCASPDEILREAIHVISCDFEDNTAWGREIGWIYGSCSGDMLTGFKMHTRGWRSLYCMPGRTAFRGSVPINLSDHLTQVFRSALGSMEILLSRHCPIWYGYGGELKLLQRVAYINATVYPLTSFPLLIYCTLPSVCLLTGRFIFPMATHEASIWLLLLFLSMCVNIFLEMRWSGLSMQEWWRNRQFLVIAGVSCYIFAVFQGLVTALPGLGTHSSTTTKMSDRKSTMELYIFKWTSLLILPTTLILLNLWAMIAGIFSQAISGYGSLGQLFWKLFFAFWVVVHLHSFLKGLFLGKHPIPTAMLVWSFLLALLFSLLWIAASPFTTMFRGPDPKECGIQC